MSSPLCGVPRVCSSPAESLRGALHALRSQRRAVPRGFDRQRAAHRLHHGGAPLSGVLRHQLSDQAGACADTGELLCWRSQLKWLRMAFIHT